ncbi:MAG: TetR family transcriptional regulator [Rhodobacterales bacterium]|nr:TetR family transcriptional regulator [Rhodobacterales bacterium]
MPAREGTTADSLRDRILDAALACAARDGWAGTSLAAVAREADVSLLDLYGRFRSRPAIVAGLIDRVDRQVLAEGPADTDDTSPRDRLFEVMMRRFDALQPQRDGVTALAWDLLRDPLSLACTAPRLMRSMTWMLEAAGIPATGPCGHLRAKGLALVHAQTFRAWARDDSPDMAGTMAALDKALMRAEGLAGLCGGRRRAADDDGPAPEPDLSAGEAPAPS